MRFFETGAALLSPAASDEPLGAPELLDATALAIDRTSLGGDP
jgi:hypothetical protein